MPSPTSKPRYIDKASWRRAITRAIEMVGGPAKLAHLCHTSIQRLRLIERKYQKCPPDLAVSIERATGGKVPRTETAPHVQWSGSP